MKYSKLKLPKPISIVRDGGIAHPSLGEGRMIPVLVLDVTDAPALEALIKLHEHTLPGDVTVRWLRRMLSKRKVILHIIFERPTQYEMTLEFDVARQGILVDSILHAHAVYLVSGKPGDRVTTTLDQPKIVAEIPDTGFLPHWNSIFQETLRQQYRKRGLSRAQAAAAAETHISHAREIWKLRRKTTSATEVA